MTSVRICLKPIFQLMRWLFVDRFIASPVPRWTRNTKKRRGSEPRKGQSIIYRSPISNPRSSGHASQWPRILCRSSLTWRSHTSTLRLRERQFGWGVFDSEPYTTFKIVEVMASLLGMTYIDILTDTVRLKSFRPSFVTRQTITEFPLLST